MRVSVLMAGLTGLVGAAGYAMSGTSGLIVSVGLAAAMNAAMLYWSSSFALRAYRARIVTEGDAPRLFRAVDRLRQNAGLPMPRVAIAPITQPNAFATGRSPADAVVCFTQGILDSLTPDELDGVIAHELAHIRNRDTLLMTVTATLAGALGTLANIGLLFGFGGRDDEGPSPVVALVGALVAPIIGMLLQFAISRQREYEADALGAAISGQPMGLARALIKLEVESQYRPLAVSAGAASLAIVNPLGSARRIGRLFMTHPPTRERVRRLEALAQRAPGLAA